MKQLICLATLLSANALASAEINTPARPPLKSGTNVWVSGEALLWQATEENLTYAARKDATHTLSDLKTVDFNWDWGFRISAGYTTPRDGWDLSLMWTHMENHAGGNQKIHLSSPKDAYVTPTFLINNITVPGITKKASAHWNIHLEQVDLGLGKEYYVGKHLTLRPNGGLRSDWIFQDYDIKYTPVFFPAANQKLSMDNRYFGFGFFAGLDTDWKLGSGFSLYSLADFALLLGYFDVDQKVVQIEHNTGELLKGKLESSFRCGRAILDLSLGLKWSQLFSDERWGLTFKAGYEYHIYFDQNQYLLTANSQKNYRPDGDLTYQGVTLSGQIDF
jgi:hypothetical protein